MASNKTEKTEEVVERIEHYADAEPDETVQERIAELKQIIPDAVSKPIGSLVRFLGNAIQVTCEASWIFLTTILILYGPVVFETENERVNAACISKPKDPCKEDAATAKQDLLL